MANLRETDDWKKNCRSCLGQGEKSFAEFVKNKGYVITDIFGLPTGTKNALEKHGVTDLRKLVLMTDKEVLKLFPIAPRLVWMLIKQLRSVGLDLSLKELPDCLKL